MKIIFATPLYPPDIAQPAPYVKELATRLHDIHDITIVLYGRLPEEIERVRIVAVDKRQSLLFRLFSYTFALWKAARGARVLYAQNGSSVELPAAVVALVLRIPLVLRMGDKAAQKRATARRLLGIIEHFAMRRARVVVVPSLETPHTAPKKKVSVILDPLERPEVLPFEKTPPERFTEYNASWDEHIHALQNAFDYVG